MSDLRPQAIPQLGKYRAILADPPWRFSTYSAKGKGRSAEAHYDCMSIVQIRELPVATWAADDCALFLWTTDPILPDAIEVMRRWGFEFKTIGFVWAKSYKNHDWVGDSAHPIGTGYWSRSNPEICLFGTKGKPKRLSRSVRKLIVAPRREHSRKPDQVYGRIEALCPGPYLEMFARFSREGWDSFGPQSGIEARRWKSNSYPTPGDARV